ncbi:uncharacterized protein [Dermacentor albipictus]|uniref:uncharacterized protein n=1 Tax=Dermacentor albipictus TaxID=60249 RepID=UPI0031FDE0D9
MTRLKSNAWSYDDNAAIAKFLALNDQAFAVSVFAVLDVNSTDSTASQDIGHSEVTSSLVDNWMAVGLPHRTNVSRIASMAIERLSFVVATTNGRVALMPYAFSFPFFELRGTPAMNDAGVGFHFAYALSQLSLVLYMADRDGPLDRFYYCTGISYNIVTRSSKWIVAAFSAFANQPLFDAFVNALASLSTNDSLPGLPALSHSRLLFVSLCYAKCQGSWTGGLMEPECGDFRPYVEACTKVFACPDGAPMNRAKKCKREVLVSTVCDCIHVVKLLMLAGDIESNPGPTDTNPNADVLAAITALSEKSDARHIELMDTLTQLKANRVELEQKVCDLTNRLAAVESQVLSLDSERVPALNDAISEAVRAESGALNSRLDDLEDRSRRDNLIFFGIPDTSSETWAESEEHVRKILSEKLDLSFPDEGIHRAHRLGSYVSEKCRPIIVKFGSSKLRDKIISQRTKFKNSKVSFSEDFSRATRQSRKKLSDFGKASGEKYLLRLNRLFIKKKCYVYCSPTDRVCEVDIAENRSSENRGTSVSASTNTVGSTSFAASSSSL